MANLSGGGYAQVSINASNVITTWLRTEKMASIQRAGDADRLSILVMHSGDIKLLAEKKNAFFFKKPVLETTLL